MSAISLVFAPHLPWWLLALLAVTALVLVAFSFWRRARGTLWRALFLALLLAFLANPILRREERAPLDDLVVLLTDRSPSQGLGERPAQTAEAQPLTRRAIGEQNHEIVQWRPLLATQDRIGQEREQQGQEQGTPERAARPAPEGEGDQ